MELGGSLHHSQQPTTSPYPSQINPFLCPSHFWQAHLFSYLVGLRTYQHPGTYQISKDILIWRGSETSWQWVSVANDNGYVINTCYVPYTIFCFAVKACGEEYVNWNPERSQHFCKCYVFVSVSFCLLSFNFLPTRCLSIWKGYVAN
jgi:hypothetical protein